MNAEIHDLREFLHVECDCVPDLGPAHCHECSGADPSGSVREWPCAYADAMELYLAQVRAEAEAEALTKLATHLDGGTPRAWGFHHPCDPPGKRWEPDETDRALMTAADIAREQAARALAGKETP